MTNGDARQRGETLDQYRLRQIEGRLDRFEAKYERESGAQGKVLIGILVALATAALLLALNLAVSVGGR